MITTQIFNAAILSIISVFTSYLNKFLQKKYFLSRHINLKNYAVVMVVLFSFYNK